MGPSFHFGLPLNLHSSGRGGGRIDCGPDYPKTLPHQPFSRIRHHKDNYKIHGLHRKPGSLEELLQKDLSTTGYLIYYKICLMHTQRSHPRQLGTVRDPVRHPEEHLLHPLEKTQPDGKGNQGVLLQIQRPLLHKTGKD